MTSARFGIRGGKSSPDFGSSGNKRDKRMDVIRNSTKKDTIY